MTTFGLVSLGGTGKFIRPPPSMGRYVDGSSSLSLSLSLSPTNDLVRLAEEVTKNTTWHTYRSPTPDGRSVRVHTAAMMVLDGGRRAPPPRLPVSEKLLCYLLVVIMRELAGLLLLVV